MNKKQVNEETKQVKKTLEKQETRAQECFL